MKPKPTPQLFEVPLTTGLEQKFDPRTAPPSIATTATNLIKVKKDVLQKRLGFTALTRGASGGGNPFMQNTGLNLGNLQDRLVIMGSGAFINGPQQISTASEFSNDSGFTEPKGLLPEMAISEKFPLSAPDGTAREVDSCVVGDYLVIVYTAGALGATTMSLYFKVIELSTKSVLIPDTKLTTTPTDVMSPKVMAVGNIAVVVYANLAHIWAQTLTVLPGATFGSETNLVTFANTCAFDPQNRAVFDADDINGDSTYFALVASNVNVGGNSSTVTAYAINASTLAIFHQVNVTDAALATAQISSLGLTGVTRTGPIAGITVAYGWLAAGTWKADATSFNWPLLNTPSIAGNIFSFSATSPFHPNKIALVYPPVGLGQSTLWAAVSPSSSQINANYNLQAAPNIWPALLQSVNYSLPRTDFVQISDSGGTMAVVAGSPATTFDVVLAGRPFVGASGAPYFLLWKPSAIQGTYFICCADFWNSNTDPRPYPVRVVATIAPRQAIATPNILPSPGMVSTLPKLPLGGTLNYSTRACVVLTTPFGQRLSPTLFLVETNSKKLFQSVQHGRSLAIAGGAPYFYDGATCSEMGFYTYPERVFITALVAGTAGPTFTADGDTASWIFTYEWYDAQGQWHYSARSPPVNLTGANCKARNLNGGVYPIIANPTFTVPTLGLTAKQYFSTPAAFGPQSLFGASATPQICVYRTAVNGLVYQRVNDPNRVGSTLDPAAIFNTLNASTVTFTDDIPDSVIASNFLLYNSGGTGLTDNVDNFCGPGSNIIVEHKRRLFISDGNRVWYGKSLTTGEGPAFNETSFLFTVGDSDPITGMCSLDANLIIFKREKIYYVGGDGPADNGQGNFSDPQPIPTEVGCSDGRSIVVTPEGTFFLSDAGLRLLTRSFEVQYAGWSIEDTISANPILTNSSQNPTTNRTVFCANTNDTSNPLTGVVISRDYLFDAWTTASFYFGGVIAAGFGLANRVAGYLPTLHLLAADGTVWRENDPAGTNPYLENGTNYISWTWESAWFRPFTSLGRGKVWDTHVKLDSADPHGVVVSLAFDDNNTYKDVYTWTWNGSGPNNIAPGNVRPTPLTVLRDYSGQKFQTLRMKIQDVSDPASVTGQGAKLLAVTLNLGQYQGPVKLPSGSTQ